MSSQHEKKIAAAMARSASLTPTKRKKIAKKAAHSRWDKERGIPQAEYTGTLVLGDMTFPCSVLTDGTRILTQSDFMKGMGMYYSGWISKNKEEPEGDTAEIPHFLAFKSLRPHVNKHLGDLQSIAVKYRTERGAIANGIKAEIIPKLCDVWIDAAEQGALGTRQTQVAAKAKLIVRALAHTGIIALVDEATGYQRDRAPDALAKILEAFIAKELMPWVRTFPDEFYEHIFRLRGLNYPRDSVKKPQYFGHLTNDIVYKRLAPGVLEELKRTTPKSPAGRLKHHLHRRLTTELGHPKLREHMASVVTIMKLSKNYEDFLHKLNQIHPPYNETLDLAFNDDEETEGL